MAMGLKLSVIDRVAHTGCEEIVDLNERTSLPRLPFSDNMDGFDLVIDPGTSEHCFNIPQALVNLAGAVKVGGVISQALPMSMFNHGYWNVNPVALLDFYELNGFAIERMVIRHAGRPIRAQGGGARLSHQGRARWGGQPHHGAQAGGQALHLAAAEEPMSSDFDPSRIYHEIVTAGEDWTDKEAAAELLEETKKTVLAELMQGYHGPRPSASATPWRILPTSCT
jgi:hypothetical protein